MYNKYITGRGVYRDQKNVITNEVHISFYILHSSAKRNSKLMSFLDPAGGSCPLTFGDLFSEYSAKLVVWMETGDWQSRNPFWREPTAATACKGSNHCCISSSFSARRVNVGRHGVLPPCDPRRPIDRKEFFFSIINGDITEIVGSLPSIFWTVHPRSGMLNLGFRSISVEW